MKLTSTTIIFSLISLGAIVYALHRLRADQMGVRSTVTWISLWFCIGFFSIFPGLLENLMRIAQMQNRMFFILIMAVFILFALVFNLNTKLDRMNRLNARLIQEIAILNYKLESATELKK